MNKKEIIKDICEVSNIDASLVKAVIANFGGIKSFKESASDVVNYGIDSGFGNFIDYVDTVDFAKKNLIEIKLLAKNHADEFGVGLLEFIANFRCLNGHFSVDEIALCLFNNHEETSVLNALAWYSAEEVCRAYDDIINDPHFKAGLELRSRIRKENGIKR